MLILNPAQSQTLFLFLTFQGKQFTHPFYIPLSHRTSPLRRIVQSMALASSASLYPLPFTLSMAIFCRPSIYLYIPGIPLSPTLWDPGQWFFVTISHFTLHEIHLIESLRAASIDPWAEVRSKNLRNWPSRNLAVFSTNSPSFKWSLNPESES